MIARFALALVLWLPALPLAGAPALVKDLYPGTATEPVGRPLLGSALPQAGGKVLFLAEDPVYGREL